jgi:predicted AlkP superfamily phosphohydrolase/phosphomutase
MDMARKLFIIAAVFSLFIHMSSTAQAESRQRDDQNVILISFDGMRHDLTKKYVKEEKLPHLKKLIKQGIWAKNPHTITPSLTAPSHAAIATGARPDQTGIVSNQWHEENKSIKNIDDGFQTKAEVPPLWVEARNSGKVTATVAFPGANPKVGKQADYSVFYGETWSPSSKDSLTFTEATEWTNVPESFSPLKEAELTIPLQKKKNQRIHLLAVDSTDDQTPNYDSFIVSKDKEIEKSDSYTKGNKWGSLSFDLKDNSAAGFWFKIRAHQNNLNEGITMYRTAVTSGTISGPNGFSEDIKNHFGFFPVQDDDKALQEGWISRNEYEEISTRFVMWVTDVSLYIKNKYQPDLLMFYGPQIDHESHQYLLTDPRQPGYTEEKAKEYGQYVEWSYKLADRVVGKTMKELTENDHLFIVSDHGMEPAHATLNPNKELMDAGLLELDENNEIDIKKSKAYAVPSGSVAHIYINLKSREKGGIVPLDDYVDLTNEITRIFENIQVENKNRGKMTIYNLKEMTQGFNNVGFSFSLVKEQAKEIWGNLINKKIYPYEKVVNITEEKEKGIKHSNAGDLVLMGAPGFVMGSDTSKRVDLPVELGTHGGDPKRSELKPVFIAAGPEMAEGKKIGSTSILDIAPTIYRLLELEAPSFVEGSVIDEAFRG